jgi:cytoskeletal protein CcmA (bactofilin family)
MAKENNDLNLQIINLIAKETLITGSIISEGDLRIDGEIQGNLESKGRLVIGESGKVEGNINCKSCEIMGTYNGKITVTELLSLKATSKITGEIYANKLSIEPGASFIGTCAIHCETIP